MYGYQHLNKDHQPLTKHGINFLYCRDFLWVWKKILYSTVIEKQYGNQENFVGWEYRFPAIVQNEHFYILYCTVILF